MKTTWKKIKAYVLLGCLLWVGYWAIGKTRWESAVRACMVDISR